MTKKIGRACSYLMLLPLALLSMFVFKLALHPAIHEFYSVAPDFLMAYGLVLIAALVHAVLLVSVVLKYFSQSLRLSSVAMSTLVVAYCVQMSWLSPLAHLIFWFTVFLSYALVWAGVLAIGLALMVEDDEQQPSVSDISHSDINHNDLQPQA